MEKFQKLRPGGKAYLIIAAMPTPNGRLHLGHMSGPYLKMDMITRARRRNGEQATFISGSDGYESYVALKAWEMDKTPEEVCHYFSNLALKDLQALDIYYDSYVNPLSSGHKTEFANYAKTCVQDLIDKDLVTIRPEKIKYSPAGNRYLVGCWLLGKCPNCQQGAGSYQCEDCGTQFRPMDMLESYSRAGDTDLVEIDDCALYLKIQNKEELFHRIDQMGFPEDFRAIVVNYLKQQGDFLRLSSPNTFGIPLKVEGSSIEQVIYTASFMNCYMVYMGKIYQQIHQHTQNPFHPDSKVITMVSFGIDCSIPYILGLSWAIESGSFKPVDYLLPNYFCNLEAAKFSTSRKHAIWAADIVEKTAVSSDTVRFYLARINPQHGITNFDIQDFFELNNDFFAGHLQNILTNSWEEVVEGKMFIPDNLLVEELEDLLIAQGNALCPPHFEMAQSLEPLERWIGQHAVYGSGKDAYWWLKGFALLAWPIMPACAQSLWKLLGMEGEPLEEQYFLSGQVEKRKAAPLWFPAVTQVELSGILPEHMKPRMK